MQSLVEETVKIHGIDAVYIPRKLEKVDLLFQEDVLANFDDYYFIEVYIKNIDSFDGDQDIFKKFGIEIKNQITFSISRSSFSKIAGKDLPRPKEGDLIYLQMSTATGLYEIKFVKEDSIFFSLGEFYIFDCQCELYAPSDENINTGIDDIDELASSTEHLLSLELGSGDGEFEVGEVAYQGPSILGADAKGTVVSFSGSALILKDVVGDFDSPLGTIKGQTAEYDLVVNVDETITSDFSAQNEDFSEESVIDFTEHNPFSEEDF
jgi:hypothetical protein